MVYGETGRYPLDISVKVRMVSYWCKLTTGRCSKLACRMYKVVENCHRNNTLSVRWIGCIERLFNDMGYSNIFQGGEFLNETWLKRAIRLRLQDQFVQSWNADVQSSRKGVSYRLFKTGWGLEQYLLTLPPVLRICNSNQLGDEYHFLLICKKLSSLRNKYIPRYYHNRPSVLKLGQLLNNDQLHIQLSKYIKAGLCEF